MCIEINLPPALATNSEQLQHRCDASCDQLRKNNSKLRRRLELLTGVRVDKSTLVRQGKKIQRLTEANAKLNPSSSVYPVYVHDMINNTRETKIPLLGRIR